MNNNVENIYKEVINALYRLYFDYAEDLYNIPELVMEEYASIVDTFYIKFYSKGLYSFMTGERRDLTISANVYTNKYLSPEYFNIPYEELEINGDNKYKKIFDELMVYNEQCIGTFNGYDHNKLVQIFAKAKDIIKENINTNY